MIIIDEYKVKLKQIKAEIDDLHGSMGIDNARKRLSEIEEITAAPDFWNDAANSHHILKEQKTVKAKITAYDALYSLYEDAGTYLELAADADDGSLDEGIGETFRNLEKTVEKRRIRYEQRNSEFPCGRGRNGSAGLGAYALSYVYSFCGKTRIQSKSSRYA